MSGERNVISDGLSRMTRENVEEVSLYPKCLHKGLLKLQESK